MLLGWRRRGTTLDTKNWNLNAMTDFWRPPSCEPGLSLTHITILNIIITRSRIVNLNTKSRGGGSSTSSCGGGGWWTDLRDICYCSHNVPGPRLPQPARDVPGVQWGVVSENLVIVMVSVTITCPSCTCRGNHCEKGRKYLPKTETTLFKVAPEKYRTAYLPPALEGRVAM